MLLQSQLWSCVGEVFKIVLVEGVNAVLNRCKTGFLLSEVRVKIVHIFNRLLQNKTNIILDQLFTLINQLSVLLCYSVILCLLVCTFYKE